VIEEMSGDSPDLKRCGWSSIDKDMIQYHDTEWGVPVHDDRMLFEFLVLEGAQAGLSWLTILKRRDGYRKAFDNFDFNKVSKYNSKKINELVANKEIIRNRLKIESAVRNAKALVEVRKEFGSFDSYIWKFVEGSPIKNRWGSLKMIPAKTAISDRMSKDLMKRGFKFVGSTICYAHMQTIGMVNDHLVSCFRYDEV
jgi:DNA-3-methyladenine glycosylase I